MRTLLQQFLFPKPTTHLGIDIGSGSIKMVEVDKSSKTPVVRKIGIAEMSDSFVQDGILTNLEEIKQVVQNLMSTLGTACNYATISLGGRSVYSREIMLPAMAEKELKEAIKWDIDQYVPYPAGTYYYDFAVVGTGDTDTEVRVLIVASPKENIQFLQRMAKETGLKLMGVAFEPLVILRGLPVQDNCMVIDIGAAFCQVIIFQQGSPAVVRTIPVGGQNFTDAIVRAKGISFQAAEQLKLKQLSLLHEVDTEVVGEEGIMHTQLKLLVDDIGREARRTFEYYQIQNRDVAIDEVYLMGGGSQLKNLASHLNNHIGIPVILHSPLEGIEVAASYDKRFLAAISGRLAVAIGLGLQGVES